MGDLRKWERLKYDESEVLAQYLWHNYSYLLPQEFHAAWKAVALRAKGHESEADRLGEEIRQQANPDLGSLLNFEPAEFQRLAVKDLLQTHPSEVAINRCPECTRIVRTPRARLCLWCGYSWHERTDADS